MEDGTITDDQIRASSQWDSNHGPNNGRLDFMGGNGITAAWSSLIQDLNQWIQVDFWTLKTVSGIVIQGRSNWGTQWVAKYKVQYGIDGIHWQTVKDANGEDAVGNVYC